MQAITVSLLGHHRYFVDPVIIPSLSGYSRPKFQSDIFLFDAFNEHPNLWLLIVCLALILLHFVWLSFFLDVVFFPAYYVLLF